MRDVSSSAQCTSAMCICRTQCINAPTEVPRCLWRGSVLRTEHTSGPGGPGIPAGPLSPTFPCGKTNKTDIRKHELFAACYRLPPLCKLCAQTTCGDGLRLSCQAPHKVSSSTPGTFRLVWEGLLSFAKPGALLPACVTTLSWTAQGSHSVKPRFVALKRSTCRG